MGYYAFQVVAFVLLGKMWIWSPFFGVLELNPFGEAKEDLKYGQGYALIAISVGCVVSFGDPSGCR